MNNNPAITASVRPRRCAVVWDSTPPAVGARPFGGGENRGEPVRAQRGGLAPAPVGGRATVAAQHACGAFPGGVRLAGKLGPKPDGGDGEGGGCGRAARLEDRAEVGG